MKCSEQPCNTNTPPSFTRHLYQGTRHTEQALIRRSVIRKSALTVSVENGAPPRNRKRSRRGRVNAASRVDALKAGACDDDVLSIITPAHAAYRDRRGRMMLHKTSFYNASVAVVQALIIANPSACSSATVTWAGFLCTSLPAPWPLPATSCRPRCAPWPCPRCQRNLPHGPCGATRRGRARRWPRTRAPQRRLLPCVRSRPSLLRRRACRPDARAGHAESGRFSLN